MSQAPEQSPLAPGSCRYTSAADRPLPRARRLPKKKEAAAAATQPWAGNATSPMPGNLQGPGSGPTRGVLGGKWCFHPLLSYATFLSVVSELLPCQEHRSHLLSHLPSHTSVTHPQGTKGDEIKPRQFPMQMLRHRVYNNTKRGQLLL